MSKRVADTYLTNVDSHPMDNDEEAPTGEFARASEEKLKKRAIVAPKRRAAASATPAASSAFSGFSFGAAAPTPAASVPAAVQPAKKPDSFTPAAAAPEVLAASMAKEAGESATKQPAVTPETKQLAQAVRGLNVSFLEFVKAAFAKDPFADLSVAAQKYTAHYNEVTSKHTDAIRVLKERSTNVVSKTLTSDLKPTPASGGFSFTAPTTSNQTASSSALSFSAASPSTSTPAAGGFTFGTPSKSATEPTTAGGFTFGIASNSSGIKTPVVAGGFTFNAPSPSQPPKPSTPAAVEASKPEAKFGGFKASSTGQWSCDTCMSSNPSDTDKCLACEAAKPGASVTAAAAAPSFGGFQASTTGNWTCNSCLVSNPSDKTKCLSCEAPKPGSAAPTLTAAATTAASPAAPPKSTGFSFGAPAASAPTATSSGFSFTSASTTTSASVPTTASSGFSFKPATTTDESKPSSGFSFTAASTTASTDATEKPKSPVKAAGGFNFGNLSAPAAAAAAPSTGASSGFSFGNLGGSSNSSTTGTTGGFSFGSSTATSTSAAPSSFGGFGSLTSTTTTASAAPQFVGFGGFGGLTGAPTTAPAPAAAAATGDEDDDDQTPPDEQIDPSTLMRGAGEESETTNHSVLTKTHVYDATLKKWSDVGKGILKVNVHKETGKARLILRADGSGRVLLNLAVFEGMGVKVEQGKSITFLAMGESGKLNKYLVKVKDAAGAALLCSEIEKVMKK